MTDPVLPKYSDDPIAYHKAYRKQPDQVMKSRERAKRTRDKLANDQVFLADRAARSKQWRIDNPKRVLAWKKKNAAKQRVRQRNYILMKKYGITPEQYDGMLTKQGGKCAICKGGPGRRWSRFAVEPYLQYGS